MPEYTPHYGFPYSKEGDYLAAYPTEVSQPAAEQVDTALEDQRNIPIFAVVRKPASGGVSITSGTWKNITEYETSPAINLGPITYASGIITITRTGIYTMTGAASFSAATAGRRGLGYLLNGAQITPEVVLPAVVNSTFSMSAVTLDYELWVGDKIQMRAFQDAGGTLQLSNMRFTCSYRRDLEG